MDAVYCCSVCVWVCCVGVLVGLWVCGFVLFVFVFVVCWLWWFYGCYSGFVCVCCS